MDMGSLRAELQLPHHFITGDEGDDLDDDIMILGSTPQVGISFDICFSCTICAVVKLLSMHCQSCFQCLAGLHRPEVQLALHSCVNTTTQVA